MTEGIGAIAQQIRLQRNLSVTGFAKELGVGKSYISKLESGTITHQPSRNFIKKFAAKYGLDEVDLLLRTGRLPVGMESAIALRMLEEKQNQSEVNANVKVWDIFVNQVRVGKWNEKTSDFQSTYEEMLYRDQIIKHLSIAFGTEGVELKPSVVMESSHE